MSSAMSFADLIVPLAPATFFQGHWEKASLYLARNDEAFYKHVLQIDDLDLYLSSQQLSPTFVKVTKRDSSLPLAQWTKEKSSNGADTSRVVDLAQLFGIYADGGTVVLNGAHKAIPRLTQFCARLEKELKFRLQTNVYITPPHAQGFAPHYDLHDVMVLQISGKKEWRLYGAAPEALPAEKSADQRLAYATQAPKETLELQAGDLLYLPRGFVHDARTTDRPSIHITLGFLPRYGYHLIEELAQIAKEDPIFRQALPNGFSSADERAKFSEAFTTALRTLLDETDVEHLLSRQYAAFVADQTELYRGRLRNLLQLPQLKATSVVSKEPTVEYLIEERGEQIAICFGEHEIIVPHYLKATLKVILQDCPFAVGDIQGLITEQGKIELLSQFVRAGLLRIEHV